ncbi:hypothetical protein CCMA1212_001187 [Trichoderma ghanense]|uniref:Uncharacterized protein n=1 Tax=Trichoderma ghanense TaxID=65468 RepID=A0ABY2HJ26_9HYPO
MWWDPLVEAMLLTWPRLAGTRPWLPPPGEHVAISARSFGTGIPPARHARIEVDDSVLPGL